MTSLEALAIRIFADGANLDGIAEFASNPLISGFTTNPTLMRASGVTNYEEFAKEVLDVVGGRPISFEVFSDDPADMARQARKIATWGPNVYVKVPITDTGGRLMTDLLCGLTRDGIHLNVTAVMTLDQVRVSSEALEGTTGSIISVFAGRIADTGRDPVPLLQTAGRIAHELPNIDLLWASPREVLNIWHAEEAGCNIITVTHDMLRKLTSIGRSLDEYSLDTVRMFYNDAQAAGFTL